MCILSFRKETGNYYFSFLGYVGLSRDLLSKMVRNKPIRIKGNSNKLKPTQPQPVVNKPCYLVFSLLDKFN